MPRPVNKLYIKTPYMGYIAPLQMMGPIITPMQITEAQAIQMLKSGMRNIIEYNPNTKMTRQLTILNIGKPWDTDKTEKSAPAAKAQKDAAPAAPQEPKVLTGAPVPPQPKEEVPQVAPEVVETTAEPTTVADQFNANELIDESKVDWNSMTKAQRREMRAKIDAQKAAAAASTETTPAETTEE